MRTNPLDEDGWANFPQNRFIPVETVAKVVLLLIDGDDMVDANGKEVPGPETYGLAVEMSGEKYYFREPPEFCDDEMREVMAATVLENQVGAVLTSQVACIYQFHVIAGIQRTASHPSLLFCDM